MQSTGKCPVFMTECFQTVANSASRSGMRSANSSLYVTRRLQTKFGELVFSCASTTACNSLSAEIRDNTDFSAFRTKLKTHFFNLAYNSI